MTHRSCGTIGNNSHDRFPACIYTGLVAPSNVKTFTPVPLCALHRSSLGTSPGIVFILLPSATLNLLSSTLGPVKSFLGMNISCDRTSKMIWLDQTRYIEETLEKFGMANCEPKRTPLPAGAQLVKADPTYVADSSLRSKYQQLIGCLLWITLGTRPDIAFAVNRLSQYASNPTVKHWKLALYVLCYLSGTSDLRLCYNGSGRSGLIGFSDSDWAENKDDRHSTSGYAFLMADAAVSWVSHRQKTVSLSSTEAEYKELSGAC